MVLLFDIGNTNIVLGIYKGEKIIQTFRYVTNALLTEDDYYQKINISMANLVQTDTIEGCIIASVVPQLDSVFLRMMDRYYHIKPLFVGAGLKSGLQIKLEHPKQLGADLLCDCVGAYCKYGGPSIVVDMGTATKLLVVTEHKVFLGGIICAGIKGSMDSLVNTTSKLSRTALEVPAKVVNNETSTSIQSGIVYGHVAMIDGLVEKIKEELQIQHAHVILTGGYARIIKDILKTKVIYDENVLLDGLYAIYQKNINR
ncbi:MAG: type III pantothenate kinase [Prevotella sp.]|nr:type III pantothenate kinase [Staphylococcus sp.]MCM1350290.1 type III pantothenate kinase [Prevotella sp.]